MARRVHVKELSPSSATRTRGAEAFVRLRNLLAHGPVEVSLEDAELVSASYLDELVRQALGAGLDGLITFVTDQPADIRKLERISAIRTTSIFLRAPGEKTRRQLVPRVVQNDARFAREKTPA